MSRKPSPLSPEAKLNKATPGTAEVGLGTILKEMIDGYNVMVAHVNTLTAAHDEMAAAVNTASIVNLDDLAELTSLEDR